MTALSFEQFDRVYQEAVREVSRYCTPETQAVIAVHCYGWSPGLFDFPAYLRASAVRFYRAYRSFAGGGMAQTICDIGGFWGVFAVTLRSLGYAVTVTEPASIRHHLEKAVHLATSGRPGPVWIDIPLDVQAATIDDADLEKTV